MLRGKLRADSMKVRSRSRLRTSQASRRLRRSPRRGTSSSKSSLTWITTALESSEKARTSNAWMTGSKLELSTDANIVVVESA